MADGTPTFIADANYFIQGNVIVQAPPIIFTTEDVIQEVRDKRARENLERIQLSHQVVTKEPSQESVSSVTQTATDSGNVILLSSTDIRLIALALDFESQQQPVQYQEPQNLEFDTWITPENFGRIQDEGVVLCTSDSTMQCVAMMMGLHVISSTGQRVAEVKRWLLRCAACGFETLDASKEFCEDCGSHELIRYALVMRQGVERELPLPKRFEPNVKGKKFSLPKARGGRHNPRPPAMSEDMLSEARRKYRYAGGKIKEASGDQFFEPRKKVSSVPQYGMGRNPNIPNHLLGKKKKH